MSKPQVGQVMHHIKAAFWSCVRVEAAGRGWAVCRSYGDNPILMRPDDQWEETHKADWPEGCDFANAEEEW